MTLTTLSPAAPVLRPRSHGLSSGSAMSSC